MSYKPIVRVREIGKKQVGGRTHPRSQARKPLKVSARQQAAHLLQGRLTTRDLELIRALIGVGMLTRHQIQRLFFNDHAKLASNRLVKLYHYHFLDRSTYWLEEMAVEGFDPCYIYTIGAAGLAAFALRMGVGVKDIPFAPEQYNLTRQDHFLLHDLQVSEMFTRLQVAAFRLGWELVWFNETATILRRGEKEIVRPDGFAVLLGPEQQWPFFVEMDRGNTDWTKKIQAYERGQQLAEWRQVLRVDGWQPGRFPPVLCVVPDVFVGEVIEQISRKPRQTTFYVQTWETFLVSNIFAAWYSAKAAQVVSLLPGQDGEEAELRPL